jgi:O-antigen chain-terminating methyltransferase
MSGPQDFDAEQLRARIHENIRKRRSAPSPEPPSLAVESDTEHPDLTLLQATSDVANVRFVSHRIVLGSLAVLAKRLISRLLTPILTQQAAYNAANARLVEADRRELTKLGETARAFERHQRQLHDEHHEQQAKIQEQLRAVAEQQERHAEQLEHIGILVRQQAKLQEELQAVSQVAETLARQHSELQAEVQGTQVQALRTMHEHVARAERTLRRILHAMTGDGGGGTTTPASPRARGTHREPGFDYAGFEERFRGREEATRERQRVYVEHFRGRERVLEIGCGRGEFLQLLEGAGVPAKGVDLDLDMVLHCRERGLDVVQEDAFTYLESLPDACLDAVFAAQVIEHFDTAELPRLIALCYRKLEPGGLLVFETLNPESLFVLYRWFWIDPTHVRLIHPETVKFLLESTGFDRVEYRFLPSGDTPLRIPPLELPGGQIPDLARFNAATDYLNKLLYRSPDYAVSAIK